MSSDAIERGFAILRMVLDPLRNDTVPVGAVAWDPDRSWFDIRVVDETQRLRGLNKSRRRIVELNAAQLRRWAGERRVPYAGQEDLAPTRTEFWQAAGAVMTSSVLLDPPKAMEPLKTEDEFEALFEAVVQPTESEGQRAARADSALTEALGPLADDVPKGLTVPAFRHRQEEVHRGARGRAGTLLVEAVNLAAQQARKDADAMVSRLLRILAADDDERTRVVIGYRSSPGGLNGESDLRDWMVDQVTSEVFDVIREANELRTATKRRLLEIQALTDEPGDLFGGGW